MAEGLAVAGARILINGTDPGRVAETVAEFRAAGHQAEAAAFNVTDEAEILRAFEGFDAAGIAVDILVNNAGIQFRKPMVELATADWQRVIDTNLTSAFMIGREAAKRMIASGHRQGHQYRLADQRTRPRHGRALHGRQGRHQDADPAMAAEWAEHGIQANAIGPGYMITDMNQALIDNPTFDAWVKGRTPAKRWGKPGELVGTASAVFLASSVL
jgi:gluconate 5-dehydrogenase